jgi:hypothetical protein
MTLQSVNYMLPSLCNASCGMLISAPGARLIPIPNRAHERGFKRKLKNAHTKLLV